MAVVVGFIEDATGTLMDGTLEVSLQTFEAGQGSTLKVTAPSIINITEGQVLLELDPLEQPYRFRFYQTVPAVLDPVSGDVLEPSQTLVYFDFLANVPDQATVNFNELAPTQIIRDNMDTSALRVAYLIANDPVLRNLVSFKLNPRGQYSELSTYTRDDIVNYDGGSYLFIQSGFYTGVNPTDTSFWFKLSERGLTGTGTDGNDTAYDSVGWDGQTDAPSRNAVRDEIENIYNTISNLDTVSSNNPTFTGNVVVPNLVSGDDSSKAVNSSFLWDSLQHILIPSNPDKPFAPTPVATDNTASIANTSWVWDRLDSLTRPDDNGDIVFRNNGAVLGYNILRNDTSKKVVDAEFVQELLSTVFENPGDLLPRLNGATAVAPPLGSDDDSVVTSSWVRTLVSGLSGGLSVISSGDNFIRLGTDPANTDGDITLRWCAIAVPTFTTGFTGGTNRATVSITLPANVPDFPVTFASPVVALVTTRSGGDLINNIQANPVANTKTIQLVISADSSLTSKSDLFVNVFTIGYI